MSVFVRHPVDVPSISNGFGDVGWRIHYGIDYTPPTPGQQGVIVYAPADMFIVWARGEGFAANNPWEQLPNNGDNGNSIIAAHPAPNQAVYSMYCHLAEIWVKEGQFVKAGTPIGVMGWTGYILPKNQNGTHLHWEVFIDYADGAYPEGTFYGRVDPLDYFAIETVVPIAPGGEGASSVGTPEPLLIEGIEGIYA
ncbi:M23 family metallopeptidase [Arthrobacter agilis]|uniref:M23 family metallopeptidase n=1 Tax=Arthrobacter agilis TaxID=37921 RepID=UPI00278A3BEB|nr:M23 family metallopeptidase [Arthrobacter agilis]MDQ0735341.1 murein DD-endopeptidase MepM/ murein hydrolase activator NlpD [Arthrobacter agilis]